MSRRVTLSARRGELTRVVDKILNEKILFGGLVLRRIDAVKWMQEDGIDARQIDFFVFHPPALPDDTPLTPEDILAQAKEITK